MVNTYTFYKESYGGWYIDLPAYLEGGGSKGDLAMVAGADTMLDIMVAGGDRVALLLSLEPFPGFDELELLRPSDPALGGGDYILRQFKGQQLDHKVWLCGVTEYVFGFLPERIYIKRA